jgi:hypothetical protein
MDSELKFVNARIISQGFANPKSRPTRALALSETEKAAILDLLNSERFQDPAPREVHATLLDVEKTYHCSWHRDVHGPAGNRTRNPCGGRF